MNRIVLGAVIAGMVALAPATLSAQDKDKDGKGRIAERKANQQKRIAKNVKEGDLTAKEALKLEKQERKLNKEIREARKDGPGITPKERVKIEKAQDKLSKEIHKQATDKQTRKP